MYEDIIKSMRKNYRTTICDLANCNTCESARFHTHKLVGIISVLKDTNGEILYLCKSLLQLPKTGEHFASYAYFIDQIVLFDAINIGM
jgi:hypothetical protein